MAVPGATRSATGGGEGGRVRARPHRPAGGLRAAGGGRAGVRQGADGQHGGQAGGEGDRACGVAGRGDDRDPGGVRVQQLPCGQLRRGLAAEVDLGDVDVVGDAVVQGLQQVTDPAVREQLEGVEFGLGSDAGDPGAVVRRCDDPGAPGALPGRVHLPGIAWAAGEVVTGPDGVLQIRVGVDPRVHEGDLDAVAAVGRRDLVQPHRLHAPAGQRPVREPLERLRQRTHLDDRLPLLRGFWQVRAVDWGRPVPARRTHIQRQDGGRGVRRPAARRPPISRVSRPSYVTPGLP